MEQIRICCKHPVCPCCGICCQDCREMSACSSVCDRTLYKNAIYHSNAFLVQQIQELADLSDHWLIQVAAQRLKYLDLALAQIQLFDDVPKAMIQTESRSVAVS